MSFESDKNIPVINKKGSPYRLPNYCICIKPIADRLLSSRACFLFRLTLLIKSIFMKREKIVQNSIKKVNAIQASTVNDY
jgi:hypothetical protein